jgi:hypothetical protein
MELQEYLEEVITQLDELKFGDLVDTYDPPIGMLLSYISVMSVTGLQCNKTPKQTADAIFHAFVSVTKELFAHRFN